MRRRRLVPEPVRVSAPRIRQPSANTARPALPQPHPRVLTAATGKSLPTSPRCPSKDRPGPREIARIAQQNRKSERGRVLPAHTTSHDPTAAARRRARTAHRVADPSPVPTPAHAPPPPTGHTKPQPHTAADPTAAIPPSGRRPALPRRRHPRPTTSAVPTNPQPSTHTKPISQRRRASRSPRTRADHAAQHTRADDA
jgi:hypothetical protein